jgi:two-component system NtrC family sensor kinase
LADSPAIGAAGAALLIAALDAAFGGMAAGTAVLAALAALGLIVLALRRPRWELVLHAGGILLLLVVLWQIEGRAWWLGAVAIGAVLGTVLVPFRRQQARLAWAESRREEMASQLDRRISELFSLQELSYVLSESIHLDRIVGQVVRYAARFLQTDGAVIVLQDPASPELLRIAAAGGSLEHFAGRTLNPGGTGLVELTITRDRIEVMQGTAVPSVDLFEGAVVRSAAVAPLRAHGVTMGAIAVADRRGGPFTTEDLWLLSTVATQASVVLANGRLFEMVRRSKDEWETAFNALAEGIAVVDGDGQVVRANRALAGMLHRPEAALLGTDLCAALFAEPDMARDTLAAARRGERTVPLVLRSEPAGGRMLRIAAAPFGEAPGAAATSLVVLVEDVTDQQSMEAQLIQNEKMAAIGQLVSGVAHELNNPLTSIAGLTELLLERGALPDTREHLRVVHEQAERASRIVRNLLTFARKGSPGKEAVDLNDVVTRTALLIVYELKLRGIELESHPASEPVIVQGDRYELQQVLLNLVTNAAQAVSELPAGLPRVVTIETALQGDVALLKVRDTGEGVPPQLVPYLFTPFFTTKGPGHGTGLGLSLSYGLVESHGGRLSYAPGPRGGAEFTAALPAVLDTSAMPLTPRTLPRTTPPGEPRPVIREPRERQAAPEPARADTGDRAGNGKRPRKVLVVDEDPAIHRLVSALFTPDGHAVEVTRSGENGLSLARNTDYDLIIADAAAAAGEGRLFVPALLAERPGWAHRIVASTRDRAPAPAELFPDAGVHHMTKPFDLRDLRSLAARILGS